MQLMNVLLIVINAQRCVWHSIWFQEQGVRVTINQEHYRSLIVIFHGLLQRRQD